MRKIDTPKPKQRELSQRGMRAYGHGDRTPGAIETAIMTARRMQEGVKRPDVDRYMKHPDHVFGAVGGSFNPVPRKK